METLNSENRNNRAVFFLRSRQFRMHCCSICRIPGHNRRTCDIASRIREFELNCEIKCQTMEIVEFNDWLKETYTNENNILWYYAIAKCSIQTPINIQECIDTIVNHIYRRVYLYQYEREVDDDENIISLLDAMTNVLYEEVMIASLSNNIYSENNVESLMQNLCNDRRLIKIYNIENVLEEEEKKEQIECSICFDEYNRQECVTFGCNHEFCKDCTKKALSEKSTCAYCRAPVTKMISRTHEIHKELEQLVV